jgi:hypothetical protein
MFRTLTLCCLLTLVFCRFLSAQQQINLRDETWWGVMTSVQVSDKWAIWNDAHFVNDLFFIHRIGFTYHAKKIPLNTTVGYGYLKLTTPWSEGDLIRSEHRPWMQTVYRLPGKGKFTNSLRFRFDARFFQDLDRENQELLNSYSVNYRWRFNHGLRYNIGDVFGGRSKFALSLINESLFNSGPGPNGVRHEHRVFGMANFAFESFTLSAGYLTRYINISNESAILAHGPVFWVFINLNAKRKDAPKIEELPVDHMY